MGADFPPPSPLVVFLFLFCLFCLFVFVLYWGVFFLHGFRNKTFEWLPPLEEHMVCIDEGD